MFLMTQYWQFVHGYSPLGAGVRMIPYALTMMIVAPLSARVVERARHQARRHDRPADRRRRPARAVVHQRRPRRTRWSISAVLPDGGRHGHDDGAGHRVGDGLAAPGEGRRRLGRQRHDPPDRRRPRRRRHRQRRVERLRQQRQPTSPAASASPASDLADGPGVARRGARGRAARSAPGAPAFVVDVKDGFVDALSIGLRLELAGHPRRGVRRLAVPAGPGPRPAGRRRRRGGRRRATIAVPVGGELMSADRTDRRSTPAPAAKRGRPRRADADEAILAATLELLADAGVAGLSMDLARPAGRRRQGDDLPPLGLQGGARPRRPADGDDADPGARRGQPARRPASPTSTRSSSASAPAGGPTCCPTSSRPAATTTQLRASLDDYTRGRQATIRLLLRRGIDRGELPADTDVDLARRRHPRAVLLPPPAAPAQPVDRTLAHRLVDQRAAGSAMTGRLCRRHGGCPSGAGLVRGTTMTTIRVAAPSVRAYGAQATEIFGAMHSSLKTLVDDVVHVHYIGPNADMFKAKCGQIAADFANQMHGTWRRWPRPCACRRRTSPTRWAVRRSRSPSRPARSSSPRR